MISGSRLLHYGRVRSPRVSKGSPGNQVLPHGRASASLSPKNFRESLDLGSVVAFPYVLTIVWQYFCLMHSQILAWTGAVIVSLAVWYVLVALKGRSDERLPWQFWPIVALPLLLIYLMRVALVDISFDVMNYHIFHSERALRGFLFVSGDFFPTAAPFNPTPDILTGLFRYLLGYRLGTIVNYAALIWTGVILERMLRAYVRSAWLRSLSVLFVLCTEQILFQINESMVDLLALPLLLEATILAFAPADDEQHAKRTAMLALLLGVATAFKLANLVIAVPLVLVYVFNLISLDREKRAPRLLAVLRSTPVASVLFIAPFAPFMILIYKLTGNPVFPLYNGIFKSPYWPQGAAFDPRWGPWGVYETLIWPVLMWFKPYRLNEFTFYSGRLSMGYLLAVICLFIARGDRNNGRNNGRNIRALAFITFLGSILWSGSSGYIRYALYLELTSGILLIWLARYLWQKCAAFPTWGKLLVQAPLWVLLLGQTYFALRYTNHWEWSTRESIFRNRQFFLHESSQLLRDRSLWAYLAAEDLKLFDDVDVWVETTYKTSAFAALLKPYVPVIGVRMPNYYGTNIAREKFGEVLQSVQGKRMFTLTNRESIEEARASVAARGFSLGKARAVSIPYFSDSLRFDMLLVEILPSWQNKSGQTQAEKGLPLPDLAFKAKLSVANMPPVMRAGQKYALRVSLRNDSKVIWPGRQPTWQFQLTIGNRWLTQAGAKVTDVDGRVALFQDLAPSETVELLLNVTAPNEAGTYILQLDTIQEGVAWFGDRGSEVLSLKVKVE